MGASQSRSNTLCQLQKDPAEVWKRRCLSVVCSATGIQSQKAGRLSRQRLTSVIVVASMKRVPIELQRLTEQSNVKVVSPLPGVSGVAVPSMRPVSVRSSKTQRMRLEKGLTARSDSVCCDLAFSVTKRLYISVIPSTLSSAMQILESTCKVLASWGLSVNHV